LGAVLHPSLDEFPPLFKLVAVPVGCLDLVADPVSKSVFTGSMLQWILWSRFDTNCRRQHTLQVLTAIAVLESGIGQQLF
jgi:hypothetical protein